MSTAASAPLTRQQRDSAELYHSDAYAWSVEQSDALRRRDFDAIDWENVIEEIESVGRTEKRIWTSKCANTITHLLKIEHARMATPEEVDRLGRGSSGLPSPPWSGVIVDNPRLQNLYPEMFRAAWHQGRSKAVRRSRFLRRSAQPRVRFIAQPARPADRTLPVFLPLPPLRRDRLHLRPQSRPA